MKSLTKSLMGKLKLKERVAAQELVAIAKREAGDKAGDADVAKLEESLRLILGAFLDCGPVPLGNRLLCFVKKPVNLPLESLARHNGGIVISGEWFVHKYDISRRLRLTAQKRNQNGGGSFQ